MKHTMVRVDVETKERLTTLAGDRPLATYLREVASKPGEPIPDTPVDTLRKMMLKKFDELETWLAGLDDTWWQSFMSHERLFLSYRVKTTLMAFAQRQGITGDAFDDLMTQVDQVVDDEWKEHLAKNGLVEVDGRVERPDYDEED